MENIDLTLFGQVISYIVTVVIGGVGYKFWKLWLEYKETKAEIQGDQDDRTAKATQTLIDNLTNRLEAVDNRVKELEDQREKAHERELEVTRQLERSKSEVGILKAKIRLLEKNQKLLHDTITKYYNKYGPLDEKIEG